MPASPSTSRDSRPLSRDMIDARKVQNCVDRLCADGCKAVWGYIDALRDGGHLAAAEDLGPAERQAVLKELCAIMAVYGERCKL